VTPYDVKAFQEGSVLENPINWRQQQTLWGSRGMGAAGNRSDILAVCQNTRHLLSGGLKHELPVFSLGFFCLNPFNKQTFSLGLENHFDCHKWVSGLLPVSLEF